MKKVIFTIFIIALSFYDLEMMTEAQMKSTANLMKKVCQPKNKISDAQIDDMHKGIFDESREEQCYMLCVLIMIKAVHKNGKMDYASSIKQIPTLPPRYRASSTITINECKDSTIDPDPCTSGYQLAKCMYFRDPEFYFLP